MVYAVGGENNFVTFTGIGYDPAVMGPTMALSNINIDLLPKKQLVSVPEQVSCVISQCRHKLLNIHNLA